MATRADRRSMAALAWGVVPGNMYPVDMKRTGLGGLATGPG
jgi:hypothetical protein